MNKLCTADQAVNHVNSSQRVFLHGGAATPNVLVDALIEESPRLRDVELIHLHTSGDAKYADPKYARSFRVANLFVGHNMRKQLDAERVEYLPCFLSEIPQLFRSGRRAIDVAMVQVSPPDRHGYCSLGVSVDVARAAVDSAKTVIAQVNRHMPRVHGDGFIHIDELDWLVEHDEPLPESPPSPPSDEEIAIGHHAASLVEDGATLQMGIGAVPDAVLAALTHHRHLGVHTEMWSDGLLQLLECGAVDNSRKVVHPGRTVSGFIVGTQKVYDYIDDNPKVTQYDIGYVNRVSVINRNPKVTAINSAVEIDLTGQVCADSIGHRIISGVGGQMDFIRGAMTSKGGKPIIALTSRTAKGVPRIVPALRPGAGVVTTRAHAQYIVTENGAVDLYGKTLSERAQLMISVAHPDDQEDLERAWFEMHS